MLACRGLKHSRGTGARLRRQEGPAPPLQFDAPPKSSHTRDALPHEIQEQRGWVLARERAHRFDHLWRRADFAQALIVAAVSAPTSSADSSSSCGAMPSSTRKTTDANRRLTGSSLAVPFGLTARPSNGEVVQALHMLADARCPVREQP